MSDNTTTIITPSEPQQNHHTNQQHRKKKKKPKTRHGARNQNRHKLLTRWLVSTFPNAIHQAKEETNSNLKERQHILDVAGGKGELSARLVFCHTAHVTMIDPRPADVLSCFRTVVFRSLPKKWQEKIMLLEKEGQEESSENRGGPLEVITNRRFKQLVTSFPCDGSSGIAMHNRTTAVGSSSEFFVPGSIGKVSNHEEIVEAVKQATLVIGMHADGATESIVDIALYFRKPFVVVPCCVFPNFFKHRFVPKNTDNTISEMIPVRTHDDFCRYLALKDSHLVVETLPFEGRNVAIWWNGLVRDGDDETHN